MKGTQILRCSLHLYFLSKQPIVLVLAPCSSYHEGRLSRLSICAPEKSLSILGKWSNSSNGCFTFKKPTNQTKPFSSFAFVSYLISFSSLMSSILKLFYLQEDFNVFWNTICRKDAKYKLYSLDLHAFAILHEHAHICSISKQQVFPKVLLLLVRNDHITQQYQSQVLSKASLAKKLKSLIISSIIKPRFGVVALSDTSKMWQWSTFTLKKHLTIAFSVVSPLLFVQSRAWLEHSSSSVTGAS